MQQRFPTRQLTTGRPTWRRLLSISFPAALSLLAGFTFLVIDWLNPPSQICRAVGGLLFISAAILQACLLRRIWQSSLSLAPASAARRQHLRRWLLSGCVLCYVIAILIGPRPGIDVLFLGLLAQWCAIWFWVKLQAPYRYGMIGRVAWTLPSRTIGRGVVWMLYAVAMTEAALRVYAFIDNDLEARLVVEAIKARPEAVAFRQTPVAPAFASPDSKQQRAFRIAVIGDEVVLCPCGQKHCVARLQRQLPELEIVNLGLPMAGPREYQSVLQQEVATHQTDLVLCFISIGSDITDQVPLPGSFDWRGLKICQLADRAWNMNLASEMFVRSKTELRCHAHHERGDYLEARSSALAVCRSPMAPQLRDRWDQVLDHVGAIAEHCNEHGSAFGIVVVPSEFQVNHALCSTLQRRMGYSEKQFDRELPQRRLAVYTQQRGILMLDLLPHLEATGATAFGHNDHRLSKEGAVATAAALQQWIAHGFGEQLTAVARSRSAYAADPSNTAMWR